MGRKKNTGKSQLSDDSKFSEIVSICIKHQLDNFMKDDGETELKFPSSLSKEERAFIHNKAVTLGIKSRSTGTGPRRYITVFKRTASNIIQKEAPLVLPSSVVESINNLLSNHPITPKEKEDLLSECDREMSLFLPKDSYLNNPPKVPKTSVNPEVMKFKQELPVFSFREQIMSCIKSNQVMIVLGETGSGKTTQIPQYILEQHCADNKPCRIVCTQPRRISTLSVAERVAYEINENVGRTIGYQIRLESKVSHQTALTYCTCGVLLRVLMSGNACLNNITHIIVDEVHERDKLTDFLLISLKEVLAKFKDLRVILMSATIDHSLFSRYFNNCPVISIPGRLFDVEQYFLDDILEMTGYFSHNMEKERRKLGYKKSHKDSPIQVEEKLDTLKKDTQETLEKEFQVLNLDIDLQAEVDVFLNDCFVEGSANTFSQIVYMYMSEDVPVNYKHSVTGMTGLMAAAYHGNHENVELLVSIGADPSVQDNQGKNAVQYARAQGHVECSQFLDCICKGIISPQGVVQRVEEPPEHNELLEMYLNSFTEDTIDYDLVLHLVQHIHLTQPDGSILVFIAGYEDIMSLKNLIENCSAMNQSRYDIFTLHSNMQTSDQKRVFTRMNGVRKIILSTNIAETSVTIDDVVYVVDAAKAKELYFETGSGACSLQLIWISKACSKQRAGRAGRLRSGKCFTLCSKRRYNSFLENSIPEILRAPLHELCLQTKKLASTNTPIADFLCKAIEPPVSSAVRNSVNLLKIWGALTPMENLTEMGQLLLQLPIDPHLGKMLIYACIFKCLDPILTITSSLCFNEPFQIGSDPETRAKSRKARKAFSGESMSDHMGLLRAFQEWTEAKVHNKLRSFCEKSFINGAVMESISQLKNKFCAELQSIGLIKSRGTGDLKDVNANSNKWHIIKAVLFNGLYPSVARVDRRDLVLRAHKEMKLSFHPQSTLASGAGKENRIKCYKSLPSDWIMFGDMSRIGRLCYIRNNTLVTNVTVALFAGPLRILPDALHASPLDESEDSEVDDGQEAKHSNKDISYLSLDDWIVFKSNFNDGLAVLLLREKFAAMMIRRMLDPKHLLPGDDLIIETIADILAKEEYKAGLALETDYWQGQGNDNAYDENDVPKPYSNSSYRPGNSPYYVYVGSSGKPRNNYAGKDKKSFNNVKNKKTGERKQTKYFIVKAASQNAIEESQKTSKWNFIPGMERHIVKAAKGGCETILFFSVGNPVDKFVGWAELVSSRPEGNPATVYPVKWLNKNQISHNAVRHVTNPLDDHRRVGGTRDGGEISYGCAANLKKLFEDAQYQYSDCQQTYTTSRKVNSDGAC